jgi:hypothetical protein
MNCRNNGKRRFEVNHCIIFFNSKVILQQKNNNTIQKLKFITENFFTKFFLQLTISL